MVIKFLVVLLVVVEVVKAYKMAGYDVIGCNEIDPRQMEIYLHNLKPKYSYLEDIRTLD